MKLYIPAHEATATVALAFTDALGNACAAPADVSASSSDASFGTAAIVDGKLVITREALAGEFVVTVSTSGISTSVDVEITPAPLAAIVIDAASVVYAPARAAIVETTIAPVQTAVPSYAPGGTLVGSGIASYYGAESGTRTANGEHFNPEGMTAAHRTLPFGTRLRVTTASGGSCIARRGFAALSHEGRHMSGWKRSISRDDWMLVAIILFGIFALTVFGWFDPTLKATP
eukprot:gene11886-11978_t